MCLLAIDCAGGRLAVLLWQEGAVRAVAAEQGARAQAARLPPLVAGLLAEAAVAPEALYAVAVATGPGSFTGIRAGIAFAAGFAAAAGLPLFGVDRAQAYRAFPPPVPGAALWVAIGSGRGSIFLDRGGGFAVVDPAEPALVAPSGRLLIAGDAAALLAAHLPSPAEGAVTVWDPPEPAEGIARAAARRHAAGERPAAPPLPLYIDPPALGPAPARR